jgi:menaquinone-specific isochorismate synthase
MRIVSRPLSDFTSEKVDLNGFAGGNGSLFVRDGVGIAGSASATRVPASEARGFLDSLHVEDRVQSPGSGPVLLGAIPFDSNEQHDFILPHVSLVKSVDGRAWVTTVDDAEPNFVNPPEPATIAASYTVEPGVSVDHYLEAVKQARNAVRNGSITKAVIARDIVINASTPIDVYAVLLRLRSSFGSSYRYLVDNFIGASPELLVAVDNGAISSHPLAGTAPRTGDPQTDSALAEKLLSSEKNQIEHRVVIDMVHDTLLPFCSYLDWQPEPSVMQVANVQHLGTLMQGMLSKPFMHVLDAAIMLSPTPALGGFPKQEALELIDQYEGIVRGRYGGAVGWFDRKGNGAFAVAIRCAQLSPDRTSARLFAGGGIVADSDPATELAETQAKFQAMLAAIIRP